MSNSLSYKYRLHEWLAERFTFIQYPNIRAVGAPFFVNEMPAHKRAFLVLIGAVALIGCAILLGFLALLAWAVITA